MSLGRLITHFSESQKVPILVDDVKKWIIDNGYQDEIRFYPVEVDPTILRGQFRQFREPTGVYTESKWVTEIHFFRGDNICWQRMVCCKEMMHIFDRVQDRTNTLEQLDQLTAELVSLSSSSPPGDGSAAFWADQSAKFKALSVLAPLHIVEKLRPSYENKSKSDIDIASILRIPEIYVHFLFSPVYEVFYRGLEDK